MRNKLKTNDNPVGRFRALLPVQCSGTVQTFVTLSLRRIFFLVLMTVVGLVQPRKEPRTAADVISYNSAISACAKAGETLMALQLLQVMVQERINRNVISYSSVSQQQE